MCIHVQVQVHSNVQLFKILAFNKTAFDCTFGPLLPWGREGGRKTKRLRQLFSSSVIQYSGIVLEILVELPTTLFSPENRYTKWNLGFEMEFVVCSSTQKIWSWWVMLLVYHIVHCLPMLGRKDGLHILGWLPPPGWSGICCQIRQRQCRQPPVRSWLGGDYLQTAPGNSMYHQLWKRNHVQVALGSQRWPPPGAHPSCTYHSSHDLTKWVHYYSYSELWTTQCYYILQ